MPTVLITGINGHLGSTLAHLLIKEGYSVRGLLRKTSNREALADINVELVVGDVLDKKSLEEAMRGAEFLVHAAAPLVLRTDNDNRSVMQGTQNVFEVMQQQGSVKKAVYISSSVTMGLANAPDAALDESSNQRLEGTAYQAAKWDTETWLSGFLARTHLPVVIVNPSTIIGPGDFRPTPTNRLIVEYLNDAGGLTWFRRRNFRAAPVYFPGGLSITDVEDVARGVFGALLHGKTGERYLLAGDNITHKEFFGIVARLTGLPAPWIPLPRPMMLVLSYIFSSFMEHPPMGYDLAKVMVGRYAHFSSKKAERDLGYAWRPARDTLRRAVKWFLASPLVLPERKRLLAAKTANL